MPKGKISKNNLRETICPVLRDSGLRIKKLLLHDYITGIIILIEKYNMNKKFYFINYDLFISELKKAISLMTGKIQINVVGEINILWTLLNNIFKI